MVKRYNLTEKAVKLLRINENQPYADRGWDLRNSKSLWGKWICQSIRFRFDGNPHNMRWPMIHLWRSFNLCKSYGHKMRYCNG